MKLFEIAQILGASLQNASPETEITGVAGIEEAGPQQITFISNPKYAAMAKINPGGGHSGNAGLPCRRTSGPAPRQSLSGVCAHPGAFLSAPKYEPGIHPTAVIDPTATIGTRGAHWTLRGDRRRRHARRRCRAAGARRHLSRSEDWAQVLRSLSRPGSRVLRVGRRCDSAERSCDRRRWLWICPRRRKGMAQDRAVRGHPAGGPGGGAGERLRGPRQHRRNRGRSGYKDRQSGAGGPRLQSGRTHDAVLAGGAGGIYASGQTT